MAKGTVSTGTPGLRKAVKAVKTYGKQMNREARADYGVAMSAAGAAQRNLARQEGRMGRRYMGTVQKSQARLKGLTQTAKDIQRGVRASEANSVSRYGTALGQSVATQFAPAEARATSAVKLAKGNQAQGKAGVKTARGLISTARQGVKALGESADYALAQALQQRNLASADTIAGILGNLYQTSLGFEQQQALQDEQLNEQEKLARMGYRHDSKMQKLSFAHDEAMQDAVFNHDDAAAAQAFDYQKQMADYQYELQTKALTAQDHRAADQLINIAKNGGSDYAAGLASTWLNPDNAAIASSPGQIAAAYMNDQGIDPKGNDGIFIQSLARSMFSAGAGPDASGNVQAKELPGVINTALTNTVSQLYPEISTSFSNSQIQSYFNAGSAARYYNMSTPGAPDPASGGSQSLWSGMVNAWGAAAGFINPGSQSLGQTGADIQGAWNAKGNLVG